jgi:hypothetical protein
LSQARTLADKARNKIALGNDPCEQRAQSRKVPTLSEFIESQYLPYVKSYKRSWGLDWSLIRNHLLPNLGKKYLDEITLNDITSGHATFLL